MALLRSIRILCLVAAASALPVALSAESITYQGRLTDNGVPAIGAYDMRFQLYTDSGGTIPLGGPICAENVSVIDGLFSAPLNFPASTFNTNGLHLGISVKPDAGPIAPDCATATGFTALTPVRAIQSAPSAHNTDRLDGFNSSDFLDIATYDADNNNIIDSGAISLNSLDASDGTPADAVFVNATGRVGIGTTTPAATLHLKNSSAALLLDNSTATTSNQKGVAQNYGSVAGGPVPWSGATASNLKENENVYCTATFAADEMSHILIGIDFDFSIPLDARIVGISIDIERAQTGTGVRDDSLTVSSAGPTWGEDSRQLASATNWPASDTVATYGGPTDLLGARWTPAYINSNFGLRYAVLNTVNAASVARIDCIAVTVFYEPQRWSIGVDGNSDLVLQEGSTTTSKILSVTQAGVIDINTLATRGLKFSDADNFFMIGRDASNTNSPLIFDDIDDPTTTSPTMAIASNGAVGFGTNAPTGQIHIASSSSPEIAWSIGASTFQMGMSNSDGFLRIFGPGSSSSTPALGIDSSGFVGVGLANPGHMLHVQDNTANSASAAPAGHLALMENTNTGTSADVLALRLGATSNPTNGANYITFLFNTSTVAGAIEGNGAGAIQYTTGAADYAEWMPRRDASENILAGDIVGVHGGRISRDTAGAEHIMVVSTAPAILGARPEDMDRESGNPVAFLGQAPIRVRGPVHVGDLIIASGAGDGLGLARTSTNLSGDDVEKVVGVAWESNDSPDVHLIRCAVGLASNNSTILGDLVRRQAEVETRLADLESRRLAAMQQELDTLRADLNRFRETQGLAQK